MPNPNPTPTCSALTCDVCEQRHPRLISRKLGRLIVTACPDCWETFDDDMAQAS